MPTLPIRVLIVDDDERVVQQTASCPEKNGVAVTVADNGPSGYAQARCFAYDCVVLDLMSPNRVGLEVCRELRTHTDVPIVIVTTCYSEDDRVQGLDAGADHYMAKPCSSAELLARIRANVRRVRGRVCPTQRALQVGTLLLDPGHMMIAVDGERIETTSYEFAILWALASRAGQPVSREELLELVTGSAELTFERSIDVHISRLRTKLGDNSRAPRILKTIRGAGYLMERHA